jgi:hypothetical protein
VAEHIEHAVIGYCHPGTVRAEFCASLVATAMEGKTPLDAVLTLASGPNISTARNRIVADFLTRQHAPWLLMVDTDMVFAGDALDRLIAAAHPVERPIIGGLCFSQDGDTSYPVMYELGEGDRRLARVRPVHDLARRRLPAGLSDGCGVPAHAPRRAAEDRAGQQGPGRAVVPGITRRRAAGADG